MNREDRRAVRAVARVRGQIAAAVDAIVAAFRRGGRLFFVGAGTSGRLGVLEAAECPPTFGTPPRLVQAIIAGGRAAVFRSREGAEDDTRAAARAVGARVRPGDAVGGVSASGVTPFVGAIAGGRRPRARRALAESGGSVRVAIVMARGGLGAGDAARVLREAGGSLREALQESRRK